MKRSLIMFVTLLLLLSTFGLAKGGGGGGSSKVKVDPTICEPVKLSINECVLSNVITARFELENAKIDDLKFEFVKPDNPIILRYDKNSKSPELASMLISDKGSGKFELEVRQGIPISSLQISMPECVGQYYVYSQIDCIQQQEAIAPPKEQPGDVMKCGGLLSLEDRVRCRLKLPGDEQNEHENFFPEECRTWQDKEACLKLYRDVAPCWDIDRCHLRTDCLMEKIGYNSNLQCSNNDCQRDLNQKILTMTKIRFYNLEEQAEMLHKKGVLGTESLVDFIVFAELKKQEFNTVKTKVEMKNIVQELRDEWKVLMTKVRR